jgi:hypothetical protein
MSKFKVFDKIQPYKQFTDLARGALAYGVTYTVVAMEDNLVAVEGHRGEWFSEDWFELVSTKKLTRFEEGFDPFYEDRDELMEWLADEDVNISQVAAWVVTHPSEKRDRDYVSHAPVWIIKIEDLPRIFDKIRAMERDNLSEDDES